MLKGLFIFCLLIRPVRRGGSTEGGGGDTKRRGGRLTERGLKKKMRGEHLVLLLITQYAIHMPPFDLPEFM